MCKTFPMPSGHNVAKRPCRGASEQEDKGDRAENSEIDGLSFAVDYGGCSETADDWTIGWATGIDKDDDDLDECEEFEDEVDVWAGGHDRIEKRGQTLRTMYMIGRCRRRKASTSTMAKTTTSTSGQTFEDHA